MTSDPTAIYRLPGFNHHIPKEEKQSKLDALNRFQTPQEMKSYKTTQKLISHSKPMKKIVQPVKSDTKVFGDCSSKEAMELHRMLMNTNSHTSAGSSIAVELYVSDLLKRTDLTRPPTPNNPPAENTSEHHPQKKIHTESLFHLEANGTNEVWIPSGRMPLKREQFATYPAVSLRREGLQHKPNGCVVSPPRIWPLDIEEETNRMESVAVRRMQRGASNVKTSREDSRPSRNKDSPTKPPSRVATRERVYTNLVENEDTTSATTGLNQSSPSRTRVPDLLEGNKIVSPPSLVSLTASHYTASQTLTSLSPRSSKVVD